MPSLVLEPMGTREASGMGNVGQNFDVGLGVQQEEPLSRPGVPTRDGTGWSC